MSKFEKVKNWVKENQAEIAYYACTGVMIIGGGLLIGKSVKAYKVAKEIKHLPVPENWGHGSMLGLQSDPTGVMGFVANIPAEQISTVGEDLAKIPVPEQFKYANVFVSFLEEEIEK